MKYIELLSNFRVFAGLSEVDTNIELDNGKIQVVKLDITKPITKERCEDIIKMCEERTGKTIDRMTIGVTLWEYADKDEYLDVVQNDTSGWGKSELNPIMILEDSYVYVRSDKLLELTRYANLTHIGYEYIDGKGFVETDYGHNPVGDIIDPQSIYTDPNAIGSKEILDAHKTSIKR